MVSAENNGSGVQREQRLEFLKSNGNIGQHKKHLSNANTVGVASPWVWDSRAAYAGPLWVSVNTGFRHLFQDRLPALHKPAHWKQTPCGGVGGTRAGK